MTAAWAISCAGAFAGGWYLRTVYQRAIGRTIRSLRRQLYADKHRRY